MREFFLEQLDYTFFVYGLAFIILSAVCFSHLKRTRQDFSCFWLGLFGLIHGANEWLDLFGIYWRDSIPFQALSIIVLAVSFLCLFEFGRCGTRSETARRPGVWIYLPVILLAACGAPYGFPGIAAGVWYFIGFPAAILAAGVFFKTYRSAPSGRIWALVLCFAFGLYAFMTGLIVPRSPFLAASIVNTEAFLTAINLPVQLVRAFCALLAAAAIWYFFRTIDLAVILRDAMIRRYKAATKWMAVFLIGVIAAGWYCTNLLSGYARENVIKKADIDMALIFGHLTEELKKVDQVALALAHTPWVGPALTIGSSGAIAGANDVLDRYNAHFDMSVSYLMDKNGLTIAASNRNAPDSFVGQRYGFRPYFTDALEKGSGCFFGVGVTSGERGYYSSAAVSGAQGDPLGVTVVKKDMDALARYFRQGDHAFFVDPNGVIFLASKPEFVFMSLWPITDQVEAELISTRQFSKQHFIALFPAPVRAQRFLSLNREHFYLLRKPLGPTGWSLVTLTSAKRIVEYRYFSIVITMIICFLIMTFFMMIETRESALVMMDGVNTRLEHEIALRKKVEEKIRETGRFNQEVISSATQGIIVYDRDLRYVVWNRFMEELTGLKASDVLLKRGADLFPFILQEGVDTALKRALHGETVRMEEFRFVIPQTGKSGWVQNSYGPHYNAAGEVVGVIGIVSDIAKRRAAEAALRSSEEQFRTLVSNIPGVIYRCKNDPSWTMQFISDEIQKLSGYPASDFIDNAVRTYESVIHPDDRTMVWERIQKMIEGRKPYRLEYRVMAADGSIKWVSDQGQGVYTGEDNVLYLDGAIFDITKHKESDAALTAAAREWSMTFDAMADGISVHNKDFEIINLNNALCQMLGKSREELVGKKCYTIFHGKDMPVAECPIEKAKRTKQKEYVEIFEPSLERWLSVSVSPIIDDRGDVVKIIHVIRDISEQKRLDELKDEFVSTVSHELRTPLAIMKEGISQVAEGLHGSLNTQQFHFLSMSLSGIERITRIVDNLLSLSRIEAGRMQLRFEAVDVVALVKGVVGNFRVFVERKGLTLNEDFPAVKIEATIDKDKVTQVLINLLGNAVKFTQQGSITVSIADKGASVECCVADTGSGISKEDMSRLFHKFEQFGRTAGPGERGVGLGLVICKGIIELHGGKIWLESDLQKGTRAYFALPKENPALLRSRA